MPAEPGSPPKSSRVILRSQADLERALGLRGCRGGALEDEDNMVQSTHFIDLRDGGSYNVLLQGAAAAATKLSVTPLVPREDGTLEAKACVLDQRGLDRLLNHYGAAGFLTEDGKLCSDLAYMREDGTYALDLGVAGRPSMEQQVSALPCWPLLDDAVASDAAKTPTALAGVQPQTAGGQPAGPLG